MIANVEVTSFLGWESMCVVCGGAHAQLAAEILVCCSTTVSKVCCSSTVSKVCCAVFMALLEEVGDVDKLVRFKRTRVDRRTRCLVSAWT